jgi:hypothetical protein
MVSELAFDFQSRSGNPHIFIFALAMKASPGSPPSKKRKGKQGTDVAARPELKNWPEIAIKSITTVTREVLKHLVSYSPLSPVATRSPNLIYFFLMSSQSVLDEDNLFEIPVVESFPDVARDYSKVVSNPMDFRTIEEDRLLVYKNIVELQQDLILAFDNCIKFNGAQSEYSKFAL